MKDNRRFARALSLVRGVVLILVGLGLVPAQTLYAHGGEKSIHYVAPNGRDLAHCDNPRQPCQTIRYAIDHVNGEGSEVRVAAGEYTFDAKEINLLVSPMVTVHGGYSAGDLFSVQNIEKNRTFLAGVSSTYRDQLRGQGFLLVQDRDGVKDDVPQTPTAPEGPTARTNCVGGMAGTYACSGIDLMARIPLSSFSSRPTSASNIWGFTDLNTQREYTLIGLRNGTAVVDVTNPASPVEVGTVPGPSSSWRELRAYQVFNTAQNRWNAYGYVVTEAGGGMQIIDLNNLPNSVSLAATYTGNGLGRAHTIYLGNADFTTGVPLAGSSAQAYINGSSINSGAFRIVDLANPIAPVLTAAPTGARYTHDSTSLTITDARTAACAAGHNPCEIFIDYNGNSTNPAANRIDIWDVTDKAAPFRISSTPYIGSAYSHSGWWTEDKRYVFIQDELDEQTFLHNSRLRVMDISNLASPQITVSWTGPTAAIDHNGYTKGNLYYMSNYRRGLTILDVSNPLAARDIAFFDTYPGSDSANFNGAWGVYPYFPSGTMVVSDIEGGLFIMCQSNQAVTGLAASSNSPQPETTPITFTASIRSCANVTYSWDFGDGATGSGPTPTHTYAAPGTYTVTVTASNGVRSQTETLEVVVTGTTPSALLTYLPMVTGESSVQPRPRSLSGGAFTLMTLVICLVTRSYTRRSRV